MKRYFLALLLFLSFSGYSQNTISNYKYVIVPEKFNFLKQKDQYSLNSLTKGLLEYKGFTVYYDNTELPGEVANNRCRALSADVLDKNGMFTTTLTVVLKDCQGNIIFQSKAGESREKDYRIAYNMALRDAFTSLDPVPYAYNGSTNEPTQSPAVPAKPATPTVTALTEPVKSTEAVTSKPVQPTAAPAASATPTVTALTEPVKSTEVVTNKPVQPMVNTTDSAASVKSTEVVPNKPVQPMVTTTASAAPVKSTDAVSNQPEGTLYAQAIANGYQLIDTTPKIVLTLLKTSAENYFIASNGTVNGIVLKKNEDWFFEYYKDGKLISEKLLVKF